MGSFLDRLLGRKPEEPVLVLEYAEVPQWLDRQQIEVRNELIGQTAAPRAAIAHSVDEARDRVNQLRSVEIDEQTPPKLKRVVETSLQPFVRAMDITLSRHFSSDPIEFYNDAVEVLKGCMKHMKGQGKYIAAVLPGEMKEIRESIGVIGTEVNTMTKEISRSERIMGQLGDARAAYRALEEAAGEHRAKQEQWELIWKDIANDETRLKTISGKISEIESEESYRAVEELQTRVNALEKEQMVLRDLYHTLVSTTGGVLRRAAYAAERQGNQESARRIQKVMQMLDQPMNHGGDILIRSVDAILPEIEAMVDENSIVLKNKSELHLFSGDSSLIEELGNICDRYAKARDEINVSNAQIAHSESRSAMEDLKQRKETIQEKHQGDIGRMEAYEEEIDAIMASIPQLGEDLKDRIATIFGETTRLELRGLPFSGEIMSPES